MEKKNTPPLERTLSARQRPFEPRKPYLLLNRDHVQRHVLLSRAELAV